MTYLFFFFNDTATTEIYTLSLHDALPIWQGRGARGADPGRRDRPRGHGLRAQSRPAAQSREGLGRKGHRPHRDRKSTRLNSSHANISYAVFCLKKKNKTRISNRY